MTRRSQRLASSAAPCYRAANWMRDFPITERWKLELRGEALNFLNSVLFGNPGQAA